MKIDAPLKAKIAFVGAWLGVLAVVWIYAGFMRLAPEPLSPFSNHWGTVFVTLMALGAVSVAMSLSALGRLGSGERKWAIGGIIGGVLVIVMMALFIWVTSALIHAMKF